MYNRKFANKLVSNLGISIAFHDTASGIVKEEQCVAVGGSQVGMELISDGFAPCVPAVAILKDGRYALYHASTGFNAHITRNATDTTEEESYKSPFEEFVDLIKDNVEAIIIFQKSIPTSNEWKAPFLALNLFNELKCKAIRLHCEFYYGIYVNSKTKNIILFKNAEYKRDKDNTATTDITFSGDSYDLHLDQYLNIKQSANEVLNHTIDKKVAYKREHDYLLVYQNVMIPIKFLPDHLKNFGIFNKLNDDSNILIKKKKIKNKNIKNTKKSNKNNRNDTPGCACIIS